MRLQVNLWVKSNLVEVRTSIESGQIVVQISQETDWDFDHIFAFQWFQQFNNEELSGVVVPEPFDRQLLPVLPVNDRDRVFEDVYIFDV